MINAVSLKSYDKKIANQHGLNYKADLMLVFHISDLSEKRFFKFTRDLEASSQIDRRKYHFIGDELYLFVKRNENIQQYIDSIQQLISRTIQSKKPVNM